jgi:hypothetical protein
VVILLHYAYTYVKQNYLDTHEISEEDITEDELNDVLDDLADSDDDDNSNATDLVIEGDEKDELENELTDILNTNINNDI